MVHKKGKWVSTDPWRGYYQPANAVIGASDTGMWSDSPCPEDEVIAELDKFRDHLKSKGISSVIKAGRSSNVFMVKQWVVVSPWDYSKAKKIAKDYLKEKESETRFIHGAD